MLWKQEKFSIQDILLILKLMEEAEEASLK
jgi:hypothetical protein